MISPHFRWVAGGALAVALVIPLAFLSWHAQAATDATIVVSSMQWGVNTCYIGGTEGSGGFGLADL